MTLYTHYEIDEIAAGTYRHTQHITPIGYVSNGTIKRISNIVGDTGDPNFTIGVNELVQFRLRNSLVGSAPVLFFGKGNNSLRLTPLGTNNVDAIVSDNLVSYPGAWDNADLRFVVGGHRVQKDILLKANHPTSFAFRIDDHIGLDFDTLECESFRILNPVLMGTNGEAIPLEWQKATQGGKLILTVNLPQGDFSGWVLDPTFTSQPDGTAGEDTDMNSAAPNANFATATELRVGETNDAVAAARTLIRFDLSSIPAGATVSAATLSLYATTDLSSNARTFRVYRQKRIWTEAGATWNRYDGTNLWETSGGFGTNDCEQTDIGSRAMTSTETLNEFKDFSLTAASVQEWISGVFTNNGALIKADTETDDRYGFASSDHATSANRPQMVVVYTLSGGGGIVVARSRFSLYRTNWRKRYRTI